MSDAAAALRQLWSLAGGEPDALSRVSLGGADPVLPSSFRIATAAQASIAAAGLAAAELWRLRTGRAQAVSVDARSAAIEFRSERYLRVHGRSPAALWDPIAGLYRTRGGGTVRLHTNFAHHRARVIRLLGCADSREAVQQALSSWDAEKFESEASAAGCVVAMFRDHKTWTRHPQARELEALPVFTIERIGDAEPRALGPGERPLSGMRVLDLTRVIAGPVCGRTLAAHGADVLRIASPELPSIEWLVIDSGRGKRSAFVDLETADGRAALSRLVERADVFAQGYRPGAIARHGFAPEDVARIRPGIVYVSLSAYSHVGPWSDKRGFDSLVQTATGFNRDEGRAAGIDGPKELPAQALDHASGQLMAFGALMARLRQAREGGSWHVRVSLAQTGGWIRSLGRVDGGLGARDLALEDVTDRIDESDSAFGRLRAVRHAAELSETPAHYTLPAAKLGTHEPRWQDES